MWITTPSVRQKVSQLASSHWGVKRWTRFFASNKMLMVEKLLHDTLCFWSLKTDGIMCITWDVDSSEMCTSKVGLQNGLRVLAQWVPGPVSHQSWDTCRVSGYRAELKFLDAWALQINSLHRYLARALPSWEKQIHDQAKGIDVHFLIVLLFSHNFRSHVTPSAHHSGHLWSRAGTMP